MNFIPIHPVEEIVEEIVEDIGTFWIYEPSPYLKRTFPHFMKVEGSRPNAHPELTTGIFRLLLTVCWHQGVVCDTRFCFWIQLLFILLREPHFPECFMTSCGGEHFFAYRHEVKAKLRSQLKELRDTTYCLIAKETVVTPRPLKVELKLILLRQKVSRHKG